MEWWQNPVGICMDFRPTPPVNRTALDGDMDWVAFGALIISSVDQFLGKKYEGIWRGPFGWCMLHCSGIEAGPNHLAIL